MNKGRKKSSWNLRDLVDLEFLLEKTTLWKKAWRNGVRDDLVSENPKTELARRQSGLRHMLEGVRENASDAPGARVQSGTRMLEVLTWLIMILLGAGVSRGLLTEFPGSENQEIKERGFNVWIFLMATLGVQWFFIILGVLSYWLWRRWSGVLGLFQGMFSGLVKKMGGEKIEQNVWSRVVSGNARGPLSWRLTRILQAGGVGYNLGLLAGLFGCLWFLKVGYYWETSLPQFGEQSLVNVTRVLTSPVGADLPGEQVIKYTKVANDTPVSWLGSSGTSPRESAYMRWTYFFLIALTLWGLLPRILMWLGSWWLERRSLGMLDFQEARHRNLWRDVTRVERGQVQSGPSDGVVVLDLGGLEIETETLRPYLLQVLRVNPEARFSLGTLDEEGEHSALNAARDAAIGVVFLVEGWNLSPKQMTVYHQKIRSAIGPDHLIRYLVIGDKDEMKQWTTFVDNLQDPEAEVFQYEKA